MEFGGKLGKKATPTPLESEDDGKKKKSLEKMERAVAEYGLFTEILGTRPFRPTVRARKQNKRNLEN